VSLGIGDGLTAGGKGGGTNGVRKKAKGRGEGKGLGGCKGQGRKEGAGRRE